MPKVQIIEDDLMIAHAAEAALVERGYELHGIVHIVAEAVALGRLHKPDLAVIGVMEPSGR